MKKLMIIALILVGALLIPAVSASAFNVYELPFTVEKSAQTYTSYTSEIEHDSQYSSGQGYPQTYRISIDKMENYQNLHYMRLVIDRDLSGLEVGEHTIFIQDPHNMYDGLLEGYYICHKYTNILGEVVKTDVVVFMPDWDVIGLSGSYKSSLRDANGIEIAGGSTNQVMRPEWWTSSDDSNNKALFYIDRVSGVIEAISTVESYQDSRYALNVSIIDDTVDDNFKEVNAELIRVFDGQSTYSTIQMYNSGLEILYSNQGWTDENIRVYLSELYKINVTSTALDDEYYFLLGQTPCAPIQDSSTVTIYIRNSQTGALLADAHIEIQDTTTDPWTEVANKTLTSGQGAISLAKDTGIHLTQYRIGATVPGYHQVVPGLFFRVVGPMNVVVEMEPLEGGPSDENNTFLDFYVRDISANAVANANVKVDGQLRWTNALGYTQFEVPKNASYPYSVTKTGYLTIEGIATVGSDDRYVVNVAVMAGAVPTHTAVTPTITVETTPTQTTPPIQEDNLIGMSVKGLAKGFGIDYDTALLLFGLMIVFGAGGIVMNSVKGGAMEFIAGSIVGTFVAFALGLIPIWIFIIIAVVFGAYILRVFLQ